MWSFNFVGSMRSSTAPIVRGVGDGDGVGVGATVGAGLTLAVTLDGDGLGDPIAPPQDKTAIASTTAIRRITSVYRDGPRSGAPAQCRLVRPSPAADRARRLAPAVRRLRRVLLGLLLRVLLAPENDLAVLCVHEDRVAFLE